MTFDLDRNGDSAVVLKLGGSVLDGEASLRLAVQEVERELQDGHRVVVVVSAFRGRTDQLQRELAADAPPHEAAAWLCRGELESVKSVTDALRASGLRAQDLDPSGLGLVAEGPVLDASSARIDVDRVRDAIASSPVVVVPGFVAVGEAGEIRLLGRGGSDWTAFLLTDSLRTLGLQVRCRLIKDVDGLYEADPRDGDLGFVPRRFAQVRFEDLPHLDTDPSRAIIQPKALEFARARGLEIDVATWNQSDPTRIGTPSTDFAPAKVRPTLRLGVLGCGTVGSELVRQCLAVDLGVDPVVVVVRDTTRPRRGVPAELLTDDVERLFAFEPDVIVEVAGGVDTAYEVVDRALRKGIDVVTANKALVAEHGETLARHRGRLRFGAAVGGGVPMVETVRRLRPRGIRRLRGVLNGTSNFVLERIREGSDLDTALDEARHDGLCESDPRLDLDGTDALQKLRILVREAIGESAETRDVESIDPLRESTRSLPTGHALRQVADWRGHGLSVRLESVPPDDPLHALPSTSNRLLVELRDGSVVAIDGPGAGAVPTVRALLADLQVLRRDGLGSEALIR